MINCYFCLKSMLKYKVRISSAFFKRSYCVDFMNIDCEVKMKQIPSNEVIVKAGKISLISVSVSFLYRRKNKKREDDENKYHNKWITLETIQNVLIFQNSEYRI